MGNMILTVCILFSALFIFVADWCRYSQGPLCWSTGFHVHQNLSNGAFQISDHLGIVNTHPCTRTTIFDRTRTCIHYKKTWSYGHRNSQYKPKTDWPPSQVYDWNPYANKTVSSWWIEALAGLPDSTGKSSVSTGSFDWPPCCIYWTLSACFEQLAKHIYANINFLE